MNRFSFLRNLVPIPALMLVISMLGCAGQAASSGSLYQQLGGANGVDRMVEAILDRVYADERIAFLFEGTDRDNLHGLIVEQVCDETGGPCEYSGLDMQAAHSGLNIEFSEFDAFVEDFILGMEDVGIPYTTQNRVLEIFAPMRSDVVYR